MFTEIELLESLGLTTLDFCFCERMTSEVYYSWVDTQDELLTRILDAAAGTKLKDQLRRTTSDFDARPTKYT